MRLRERWFDLAYVHVTRPFVAADRQRYRTFFEALDGIPGPSHGEVTGGIDKWVPRWRVRQMVRAGWRRV